MGIFTYTHARDAHTHMPTVSETIQLYFSNYNSYNRHKKNILCYRNYIFKLHCLDFFLETKLVTLNVNWSYAFNAI